jgi:hypothetical protein
MSRRQSVREDLLREATALVQRAELSIPGYDEHVVIGFRRDGSASFFFGGDPVYQFNTAFELRRANVGELIYKADRGRLVVLRRERSETEVVLLRTELSDDETAALLATLRSHLTRLHEAIAGGSFDLVGQVPTDADIVGRIGAWLAALPQDISVARAPNAG